MSSPAIPAEADVLKAIADTLSKKRTLAALAHYPTLRIQTRNLQAAIVSATEGAERVLDAWAKRVEDGGVAPEFQEPSALAPYRVIAPLLVRNVHRTSGFLLDETRPAPMVDLGDFASTEPSFSDFVRLGAAVRAFLDALVQTAYQLTTFDAPQLNYKFLRSLLSFAPVAPDSLHVNIASPEMQAALDAYAALSSKEKKNSAFTKASNEQFGQRLRVAGNACSLPDPCLRNLELLFDFCSDFVHSGYVSVLAIGDADPGIPTGGPGDVFTARAENFAELKHRLLAECAGAYGDVLMPALQVAIARMLVNGVPPEGITELDAAAARIRSVRAVLGRKLIEPIRKGLLGSGETMRIDCTCGGHRQLLPPHDEWDRFCPECGSCFVLLEVDEMVDYVVSPSGAGDVLGGDAPKIDALAPELRAKLDRIAKRHAPNADDGCVSFVLLTDLARCHEETLAVPSIVTSTPTGTYDSVQSRAFVAAKSLERCARLRIRCDCGAVVEYLTARGDHVCECAVCRRIIGLFGVSGDGKEVATRPGGTLRWGPIQARLRFKEPGVAVD